MSDSYVLSGSIKEIGETQTFDSGFMKREFVVSTGGDYNQDIKFEILKDKVTKLDQFEKGANVEVAFNVKGNEYNGKYYVNLQAWKIDGETSAKPADPLDDGDDIPF